MHANYEIIENHKSTPDPDTLETDTSNSIVVNPILKNDKDIIKNDVVKRHHHKLSCKHADLVTFWDEPSLKDIAWKNPYTDISNGPKYVTFEPDVGGWNNIRMQMELILVFAAATGRTLVLPPDQPMYLLNKGKGHQKEHSFADFFPFEHISQILPVISMTGM